MCFHVFLRFFSCPCMFSSCFISLLISLMFLSSSSRSFHVPLIFYSCLFMSFHVPFMSVFSFHFLNLCCFFFGPLCFFHIFFMSFHLPVFDQKRSPLDWFERVLKWICQGFGNRSRQPSSASNPIADMIHPKHLGNYIP